MEINLHGFICRNMKEAFDFLFSPYRFTLIYSLARAKSQALVNNTCKQQKLNRVMLNGDDIENGSKTNRSN